ncbi:MAG: STAS/SEC14 domain-containing protein [Candidatus Promineifilaceae bacterium]
MTTIQLQSSVTPDQLLHGIGQLEHEEFEKIFSQLTILRAQRRYFSKTEKRESELLKGINGCKLSVTEMAHYQTLDAKFHEQTLTDNEHDMLLTLSEKIEQLDVDRLEYLIELAQLWKTSVPKAMEKLGLQRSSYVVN